MRGCSNWKAPLSESKPVRKMWEVYGRGRRRPELNSKLKWQDSTCDLSAYPGHSGLQGKVTKEDTTIWMQHTLWFRERAGKSWPLVSSANYQVVVRHFFSIACLATSVDRTSASAFSKCWHGASFTLMTHCCFHRFSCYPAGSVEMWNAQKLRKGFLPLGTIEVRETVSFTNVCLVWHM